jgi:hypothetical protein
MFFRLLLDLFDSAVPFARALQLRQYQHQASWRDGVLQGIS